MAAPQYPSNTQLFMTNISFSCNQDEVHREIARVLHSLEFNPLSTIGPINFSIQLFRDKRGSRIHGGTGVLTLPKKDIYDLFLWTQSRRPIIMYGKAIRFSPSRHPPQKDLVQSLNDLPYINPAVLHEEEKKNKELSAVQTTIKTIQCGWDCRDSYFSNEWQLSLQDTHTIFATIEGERREIRIQLRKHGSLTSEYMIVVSIPQIQFLTIDSRESAFHLALFSPPSFEAGPSLIDSISPLFGVSSPSPRQRSLYLPFMDDLGQSSHADVVPYLSKSLRFVCKSRGELEMFAKNCSKAEITFHSANYPVVRRNLFRPSLLKKLHSWMEELDYQAAFQVELLIRGQHLDFQEMYALQTRIDNMILEHGVLYVVKVLRQFAPLVMELWYHDQDHNQTLISCFLKAVREVEVQEKAKKRSTIPLDDGIFNCLHVSVTPTTYLLEGPFPERSNRILRKYKAHQDNFLRVSFVEENGFRYRFDREINGLDFIKQRVGHILKEGLTIGGRHFDFLAYSQSALKEHTVWFCSPFTHTNENGVTRHVNSSTIVSEMGTFKDIKCPARYAARVSQAFTATDASITLDVEEIIFGKDIPSADPNWVHTDGNGCFSPQVGEEIHTALQARRRKSRRDKEAPASFQVRIGGSKGMLHRDYRLTGRTIIMRPSMLKFDDPDSRNIEIARVFDKPGLYYLNRPLLAILEHLGIPYSIVKSYLDKAVKEAYDAAHSIPRAARLLESHGLGASFRLPSVLVNLKKLGIANLNDEFYDKTMKFVVNHVLRELKQKARIPIPGAYTLVGVADVHGFLREGEIFACIKHINSDKKEYLEGDILISRSPTIHPGDVRVVRAIGRPPPGSCFEKEPLANTVVFATKGDRPLPSCLGGGDLDGDEYNLVPLENPELRDFRPMRTYPPGQYEPAKRHILDRPSTMSDVADFVVQYINSDVLGIIAITWLIIADQSVDGVLDPDCMKLSQLHSDAVDYPKGGVPVPISDIPRLKHKSKPDWNAPETVTINPENGKYYESKRFIGRLFRAIDLPALQILPRMSKQQRRRLRQDVDEADDTEEIETLLAEVDLDNDPVYNAVMHHVGQYMDVTYIPQEGEVIEHLAGIYGNYVTELHHICTVHSLTPARGNMLTEEEAVAGTIVAKTSQQAKRQSMMAKLREQTDILVRLVREEVMGDEEISSEQSLERGCLALKLALSKGKKFGAKSFWWLAMGVIFEMTKRIDEEEHQLAREANRRN